MDIKTLIERLSREAYGSDIEPLLLDAATALSTLQAKCKSRDALVDSLEDNVARLTEENEQLRAEAEHWKNAHHQAAINFQQENRECNKALAELEAVRAEMEESKH